MTPEQAVELLAIATNGYTALLVLGVVGMLSLGIATGRKLAP